MSSNLWQQYLSEFKAANAPNMTHREAMHYAKASYPEWKESQIEGGSVKSIMKKIKKGSKHVKKGSQLVSQNQDLINKFATADQQKIIRQAQNTVSEAERISQAAQSGGSFKSIMKKVRKSGKVVNKVKNAYDNNQDLVNHFANDEQKKMMRQARNTVTKAENINIIDGGKFHPGRALRKARHTIKRVGHVAEKLAPALMLAVPEIGVPLEAGILASKMVSGGSVLGQQVVGSGFQHGGSFRQPGTRGGSFRQPSSGAGMAMSKPFHQSGMGAGMTLGESRSLNYSPFLPPSHPASKTSRNPGYRNRPL